MESISNMVSHNINYEFFLITTAWAGWSWESHVTLID